MTHTITAIKARQNLGEVLNRVMLKHDEFIIERGGKPMAAVIPIEKLEQLRSAAARDVGRILGKAWGRPSALSQPQADRLADEAKHQTRPKRVRRR